MTFAKRKRVIKIEAWQRTVIRQVPRQTQRLWCEFCGVEVEMTTPESASITFNTKLREIYQQIENGNLHFIEGENYLLLICVNSLKAN